MTTTQGWISVVVVLVVLGYALYWHLANQPRIIPVLPVLSESTSPTTEDASQYYREYYLYVPDSSHSTCTWTYDENGTPQSFSTQPDPKTGQHLVYESSVASDMQVTCLSDQGIKYVGQFSN